MIAIDTNILVYAVDSGEPVKQSKAADLLDRLERSSQQCILLWQVAAEFLSCLRKFQLKGVISVSDVETYMQKLLATFPLVLPTESVIDISLELSDISLELSSKFSLSHWDSMLLAACIDAGVETLYTEDMDADTLYKSLALANPFT